MILKDVKKKLHSEKGVSILYAMMLFMIATFVSVLILASAVSALKRHEAEKRDRQASLIFDSAIGVISSYINNQSMSYVTVHKKVERVTTNKNGVIIKTEPQSTTVRKMLEVKDVSDTVVSKSYIEVEVPSGSGKEVPDSMLGAAITYESPGNGMPAMLQNGLLNALIRVDKTGTAYDSSSKTEDNGKIILSLSTGSAEDDADVELTYSIAAAPITTDTLENAFTTVYTFTYKDKKTGEVKKTYLKVPTNSIKSDSGNVHDTPYSYNQITGERVVTRTTVSNDIVTWQDGTKTGVSK